jgi:hypothetical protein
MIGGEGLQFCNLFEEKFGIYNVHNMQFTLKCMKVKSLCHTCVMSLVIFIVTEIHYFAKKKNWQKLEKTCLFNI